MSKCAELYEHSKNNPTGLRFKDLCQLAECYGFVLTRSRGSHRVYKRAGQFALMDFQEAKNGMAKAYQVRQLLAAIQSQRGESD